MKTTIKIITAFLLMYSLLLLTACPKAETVEKSLRKARESSAQMSIYGTKIVNANVEAYQAKEISPELFKELTVLTGKFSDGLKIYRDALDGAEKIFAQTKNLPSGTVNKLAAVFDEQVVATFLALADKLNLVRGAQAETIKTALASIRLTILALQGAFAEARANSFIENAAGALELRLFLETSTFSNNQIV